MYYGEVAEWAKASDCKSLQSLVRIQPSPPVFRASVTVAQQTPNLLDGVRFPGSEPVIGGISLGAKLKISNLSSSVRFRYPAPILGLVVYWLDRQVLWSRSINGDAVGCKSAVLDMPGSIPGYSTKFTPVAKMVNALSLKGNS